MSTYGDISFEIQKRAAGLVLSRLLILQQESHKRRSMNGECLCEYCQRKRIITYELSFIKAAFLSPKFADLKEQARMEAYKQINYVPSLSGEFEEVMYRTFRQLLTTKLRGELTELEKERGCSDG